MNQYPHAIVMIWFPLFDASSSDTTQYNYIHARQAATSIQRIYHTVLRYKNPSILPLLQPLKSSRQSSKQSKQQQQQHTRTGLIGSAFVVINPPHLYDIHASNAMHSITRILNMGVAAEGEKQ